MKNQFPERLEIFLALALNRIERENLDFDLTEDLADAPDFENQTKAEFDELQTDFSEKMPALFNYLNEAETEKLKRLWREYEKKSEIEKIDWRERIIEKIGADEQFIDEQVHPSHIAAALCEEIPAVRRIVRKLLPPDFDDSETKSKGASETVQDIAAPVSKSVLSLEKTVRRAFAGQFAALRDLKRITAFDRLSGAQMARLIRLTGIREVAAACVRIEAVEAVAAFLRIFSAEDAQAIAAQLNALPKISETRLDFAENLVQMTLETEPQSSAMLDSLGIRLLCVLLCQSDETRVRYTTQKLPLEIAPKLSKIIDEQRRQTAADLRKQISLEIERLAETLVQVKSGK